VVHLSVCSQLRANQYQTGCACLVEFMQLEERLHIPTVIALGFDKEHTQLVNWAQFVHDVATLSKRHPNYNVVSHKDQDSKY